MSKRKKDIVHQSFGVFKDHKYERHGFRPKEDTTKIVELKKAMDGKPKDRRLLSRFLVARDSMLLQLELGKLEKELEESGFSDIKKVVDDDLKRKIQLILRSGK